MICSGYHGARSRIFHWRQAISIEHEKLEARKLELEAERLQLTQLQQDHIAPLSSVRHFVASTIYLNVFMAKPHHNTLDFPIFALARSILFDACRPLPLNFPRRRIRRL